MFDDLSTNRSQSTPGCITYIAFGRICPRASQVLVYLHGFVFLAGCQEFFGH